MYSYNQIDKALCFFKNNTKLIDELNYLYTLNDFFFSFILSLNKLKLSLPNEIIYFIYEIIFNRIIYSDFYINYENYIINDAIMYEKINEENIELIFLYIIKKKTFFDTFSFYNYKTIQKNYNLFDIFFDIGYIYVGMGHLITFSKIKDTNLFFFRKDGGSNGFDILFNDIYIQNIDFDKNKKKLLKSKELVKLLSTFKILNQFDTYIL
jgi:hypothetical protein